MSDLRQRIEPIRSDAIRRAAAREECTIGFVGICSHNPETTVLAHIHDEQFGRSRKADDTSGCFACFHCHTAYDLKQTGLSEEEVLWYILRAYQRTIRRLVEKDVLIVKGAK